QRRTAAGGSSASTPGPALVAPVWLRLTRSGNAVAAYVRKALTDTWTLVGRQTFAALDPVVNVGLAVASHADGTLATATFSGTFLGPLPRLTATAIGAVSGGATTDGTTYTVHASGADIWNTSDAFVFVAAPTDGNAQITLRVRSLAST